MTTYHKSKNINPSKLARIFNELDINGFVVFDNADEDVAFAKQLYEYLQSVYGEECVLHNIKLDSVQIHVRLNQRMEAGTPKYLPST